MVQTSPSEDEDCNKQVTPSDLQVGFINDNYQDDRECSSDDEEKGYECVEQGSNSSPDEICDASEFATVSVVNSNNVHFGNKTVYQGPVTVLKQIVVPSIQDRNQSLRITSDGALPGISVSQSATNKKDIEKSYDAKACVCLTNRRVFVGVLAGAVIMSGIIITVAVTISMAGEGDDSGKDKDRRGRDRGRGDGGARRIPIPLGDTGDGTLSDVYTKRWMDGILNPNTLRIWNRSQWLAQPPVDSIDALSTPVQYVIISHSAAEGCDSNAECIGRVRYIQMFHIEFRHWADIGYNFLVGGDGGVYEGRGWDQVGAHTLGWNNVSIGICAVGTFTTIEPTTRQMFAMQKLIERGVALGKIAADYKLLAHCQLSTTESPGRLLYGYMQKWPHWYNTTTPPPN